MSTPQQFQTTFGQTLGQIQSGLDVVLAKFKQTYILSKSNPQNEDYKQQYDRAVVDLKKTLSDFYVLSNNIQLQTNTLNVTLDDINTKIEEEKKKNKYLKKKLWDAEHINNSAVERIDEYREIYDSLYLRNWGLFLGMLSCAYVSYRIYSSKPGNLPSLPQPRELMSVPKQIMQ